MRSSDLVESGKAESSLTPLSLDGADPATLSIQAKPVFWILESGLTLAGKDGMGSPELAGAQEALVPDPPSSLGGGASLRDPAEVDPTPIARRLLRRLAGLDVADTSFLRRRFRGDHESVRPRLEKVGATFVRGFNEALEEDRPEPLARRLDRIEREWQGFAYEGAGMALAILDWMTPWRRDRIDRFLAGPGDPHLYLVIVGAGWISARLPVPPEKVIRRFDPTLRWLALDGYGFHEGFFDWPRSVEARQVPERVKGYARRAFDFGLGRSLWFVDGADVRLLPRTIARFPADRQADLWSGLGLAVGYAGGRPEGDLEELGRAAGPLLPQLRQGVAFAVGARDRAHNLAPHTELAARVLCGRTAREIAELTDALRPASVPEALDVERPAFETWRLRIQQALVERGPL